jgi:hypothetical protein
MPDGDSWGAGTMYTYPLSKRTAIYAAYSYFSNDKYSIPGQSIAIGRRILGASERSAKATTHLAPAFATASDQTLSSTQKTGALAPVFLFVTQAMRPLVTSCLRPAHGLCKIPRFRLTHQFLTGTNIHGQ